MTNHLRYTLRSADCSDIVVWVLVQDGDGECDEAIVARVFLNGRGSPSIEDVVRQYSEAIDEAVRLTTLRLAQ